MDNPCPHCGNRQHAPGATICRVCGHPLSIPSNDPTLESIPNSNHFLETTNDILPNSASSYLLDRNGSQYMLNPREINTLGSSPSDDIFIQGSEIKPRHARLFQENGQFFIEALIGCLVFVNGRALSTSKHLLHNHDLITIGENQSFVFQIPEKANQNLSYQYFDENTPEINSISQPVDHFQKQKDCNLYGYVRFVDGPYAENPDSTFGNTVAKTAGFMLALWKPAFLILQKPSKQVPVRFLRVETMDGQLRIVKMKGDLESGVLHTGDLASFWGYWQNGTLIMQKGYNETTQTFVTLKQ